MRLKYIKNITDHNPEGPPLVSFEVTPFDSNQREHDVGQSDSGPQVKEGEVAKETGEEAGRQITKEIWKVTQYDCIGGGSRRIKSTSM